MLRTLIIALVFIFCLKSVQAVEGMWLPILLDKYNIEEMQAKGFKLNAEDIYSINQSSLKDGVVGLVRTSNPFRNFCSGELISGQGLFITNHHCGYRQIQSHSSIENDYLTNGFWAMNKEEELPNDGMGITLFKRMEDVTARVLEGISMDSEKEEKDSIIAANIKTIEEEAIEGTQYKAKISPFFGGNEYYMTVIEVFTDIRLVGAPPSAIGKFGGDTDNWMWPRHTGDFSLFRIYADSANMPAEYNESNQPFKPSRFFEISLDGVKKDDFTMVLGYPGTTVEYLPSFALAMQTELINPARINIRSDALDIIKTAMEKDPSVRIQYAAKAASMSNGWKKWIGENRGLKRLNAIEKKKTLEKDFQAWVNEDAGKVTSYGDLMNDYEKIYSEIAPYKQASNYFWETAMTIETVELARGFYALSKFNEETSQEEIDKKIAGLKKKTEGFFKNYHKPTDKQLFALLITHYHGAMDEQFMPASLSAINKKYKGNYPAYADGVFAKTMFCDPSKVNEFLDSYSLAANKKLAKDPVFVLVDEWYAIYNGHIASVLLDLTAELDQVDEMYLKALREFQSNKNFYPDANSTFRVAYGNVDDYSPRDGVHYHYQTTVEGIMQKDNPDIYDYRVPEQFKTLYAAKDYGEYANEDGSMPVCFTASNHTTGGNSGSPVLNAHGQLIGINFDRNWEGTMSDLMYDPDMCRNIVLDIRYALFIVDKYAGAKHLIEELSTIKSNEEAVTKSATLQLSE